MAERLSFACSPLWFEFAVNFSQTCNNTNLTANPGLLDQGCVEWGLGDNNITNLAPVAITSIFIEELELFPDGTFFDILQNEHIPGNFLDGDTFNYTSALSTDRTVPPYGIQMSINGLNNASEEIFQYFFIIYSNENYEPVLKPGDGIGWVRIVSAPSRCVCMPPPHCNLNNTWRFCCCCRPIRSRQSQTLAPRLFHRNHQCPWHQVASYATFVLSRVLL